MKKHFKEFLKRGLIASIGGPIILAVVYYILSIQNVVTTISATKIATEILTVSVMAFIASGISVVYNIEKLPLFSATFIHGTALYFDYILIYLLNGWLKNQIIPILIFTGIFILGYIIIWVIIYFNIKNNVNKLNKQIKSI